MSEASRGGPFSDVGWTIRSPSLARRSHDARARAHMAPTNARKRGLFIVGWQPTAGRRGFTPPSSPPPPQSAERPGIRVSACGAHRRLGVWVLVITGARLAFWSWPAMTDTFLFGSTMVGRGGRLTFPFHTRPGSVETRYSPSLRSNFRPDGSPVPSSSVGRLVSHCGIGRYGLVSRRLPSLPHPKRGVAATWPPLVAPHLRASPGRPAIDPLHTRSPRVRSGGPHIATHSGSAPLVPSRPCVTSRAPFHRTAPSTGREFYGGFPAASRPRSGSRPPPPAPPEATASSPRRSSASEGRPRSRSGSTPSRSSGSPSPPRPGPDRSNLDPRRARSSRGHSGVPGCCPANRGFAAAAPRFR